MKKIVYLCLLAVLCLMVQPLRVYASEPTSGTWGDNIVWEYEDGVLTFSGVGEMEDSGGQNPRNWRSYSDKVTKVVVEKGITKLTNNFVQGYELLTSVSLPEGLTEISGRAFSMCSSLKEINIPSTVTVIWDNAFYDCSSLKEIRLPDGLQRIDMEVFWNCTALESISIPASVTFMGGSAFYECSALKTIYFYGDAPMGVGSTFQNVTAAVYYPRGNSTWEAAIPEVYMGNLTWEPYCGSNHTEETVAAVAPGCTTTGLTEGKVCKYCDEVLKKQEVIPATGHSFGEWEIVDESGQEGVLVERSCATCGHTEQKLLEDQNPQPTDPEESEPQPTDATEPSDEPMEPSGEPMEPSGEPMEPSGEETEPVSPSVESTAPSQPGITMGEPKDFPWAVVVISVLAVAAIAVGFLLGRKRK